MTLGLMGAGQVIFKVLLNATNAYKMLHFPAGDWAVVKLKPSRFWLLWNKPWQLV